MALDGCGLVCKYILVIFNIIFAVVGLAFFGLGLWLRFSGNTREIFQIEALNSSAFVIGVTILIVLGAVMLIVVSFGDYGACSEKRWALQVFSVLLGLLAAAEIAVGVLAYSNRDEVGIRLGEFYASLYTLYVSSGDPAMAITLTFIHNTLHCCGVTGVSLIEIVKETCPKPNGFLEKIVMSNCPVTIADVFNSNATLVLSIFVGTGVLLILALICSAIISSQLRRATPSPQYIILTNTTPALGTLQPSQQALASMPYPDQDPVFFTPLSEANLPGLQA